MNRKLFKIVSWQMKIIQDYHCVNNTYFIFYSISMSKIASIASSLDSLSFPPLQGICTWFLKVMHPMITLQPWWPTRKLVLSSAPTPRLGATELIANHAHFSPQVQTKDVESAHLVLLVLFTEIFKQQEEYLYHVTALKMYTLTNSNPQDILPIMPQLQ